MNYMICSVTHEDDTDGTELFLLLTDDIPTDVRDEALAVADSEFAWVVKTLPRAEFDKIQRSIEIGQDYHSIGDGYMIELYEDYSFS